jgi:hypothetical protein
MFPRAQTFPTTPSTTTSSKAESRKSLFVMAQNTRGRKRIESNFDQGVPAPLRATGIPAVVSLESDVESTVSIGTNGTVRSKIPKPTLKQLFYDIEHAGGIQEFDKEVKQALNILLDSGDPVVYGFRGDKVRKRLTNKVYQWKKLSGEKYRNRLFKIHVQPAETLRKSDIVKIVAKTKKRKAAPVIPEEVAVIPDSPLPDERPPRPIPRPIPRRPNVEILRKDHENYEVPTLPTLTAIMRGTWSSSKQHLLL